MPIISAAAGEATGTFKPWLQSSAPAGWLKCNGAAISRTLYAKLFGVIGTTYGVGDGSTTFNLPDFRGEFIRGLDDGRGIDASRALGTAQGESFASHAHTGSSDTHAGHSHGTPIYNGTGSTSPIANYTTGNPGYSGTTSTAGAHSHALTINNAGGTETRPRNQAALFIIKY